MKRQHEARRPATQHRWASNTYPKWLVGLLVLVLLLSTALSGCGGAAPTATPTIALPPPTPTPGFVGNDYWPTGGWRVSTPEEQGVDSAQLLSTLKHIDEAGINVRTIMVIRNGYVVLEAGRQPFTLDRSYQMMSVTKSVLSALMGIAIEEGYIKDIKQQLLSFFPGRAIANRDARKEAITIEDLLTMQPGLDCSDDKLNWAMEGSEDWMQFALDLPMASPSGQTFVYCTVGPHMLSAILTKATGMSTQAYAQSRLFGPLGIAPTDIVWGTDPQGITLGGYGISMKPANMAKLGLLYLNGGKWEGKQVVPEKWVTASTRVHAIGGNDKNYGYLFWVYPTHFAAEGYGEQKIMVVKDRNMVVAMTAAIDWKQGAPLEKLLREYIIPAAKSDRPLAANPTALANLQAEVKYLANPVQPVQPLSETARRVSGTTYEMQDNSQGWKTITAIFREGAAEAMVTLEAMNGATPVTVTVAIGMDNMYRVEKAQDGNFTARRGWWADDHTWVVRQVQSSPELEESEIRVDFSGNTLKAHVQEMVFGNNTQDIVGTAVSSP